MSLSDLEELLRRRTGLDAASIGSPAIARAVQEREAAAGLEPAQYLERVRGSEAELQELVEAIVVPETWFFRDAGAFTALADAARRAAAAGGERVLRLLSLPCSSGEEPYSMAMALLDAGVPGERFRIDAVDISLRALRLAEAGVYGRNAFRGRELAFRSRHFEPRGDAFRVADGVRRQVQFWQGNVLDPGCLPAGTRYDLAFCRNLLIYFEREMQERAMQLLAAPLADTGLLFAGAAESQLWLSSGWQPARIARAFAFRRPGDAQWSSARPALQAPPAATRAPGARGPGMGALAPGARAARAGDSRSAARRPAPAAPAPAPPAAPADELDAAQRLADQGQLAEAIAACERHLAAHAPSARAFHLLALAHDARGDAERAEECYRKTLYLDPGRAEALTHLAYLLEKQGDAAAARLLRERAARAQRSEPERR